MPVVELKGGPLHGVIHELAAGFPPPDMLSFPKDGARHYYRTRASGKIADFHNSEPEDDEDDDEDCDDED